MTVLRPSIISRAQWGARPPRGPYTPGRLESWSYHHWASVGNVRSFDDDCTVIRGIQSQHMVGNGWNDIAGNFYVTRSGRIFEARPFDVAAGITGGFPFAGGVEHEGYFHPPHDEDPADYAAQWAASVALDAWVCDRYGWSATIIKGHREYAGDTACPGNLWMVRKTQYIAAVVAAMTPTIPPEEDPMPLPVGPAAKEYHTAWHGGRVLHLKSQVAGDNPGDVWLTPPGGTGQNLTANKPLKNFEHRIIPVAPGSLDIVFTQPVAVEVER